MAPEQVSGGELSPSSDLYSLGLVMAEALTGRTPAGGDQELLADEARSFPTLGSSVSYALGSQAHVLPYVALPYTIYNVVQLPGQTPGFLGGAYDRFQVSGNPNGPNFRISALEPPANRQAAELMSREDLLHRLDALPGFGRATGFGEQLLSLLVHGLLEIERIREIDLGPGRHHGQRLDRMHQNDLFRRRQDPNDL
jgi:serine/threonine protein kinase